MCLCSEKIMFGLKIAGSVATNADGDDLDSVAMKTKCLQVLEHLVTLVTVLHQEHYACSVTWLQQCDLKQSGVYFHLKQTDRV